MHEAEADPKAHRQDDGPQQAIPVATEVLLSVPELLSSSTLEGGSQRHQLRSSVSIGLLEQPIRLTEREHLPAASLSAQGQKSPILDLHELVPSEAERFHALDVIMVTEQCLAAQKLLHECLYA